MKTKRADVDFVKDFGDALVFTIEQKLKERLDAVAKRLAREAADQFKIEQVFVEEAEDIIDGDKNIVAIVRLCKKEEK